MSLAIGKWLIRPRPLLRRLFSSIKSSSESSSSNNNDDTSDSSSIQEASSLVPWRKERNAPLGGFDPFVQLDTWHWVSTLQKDNHLNQSQSEALLTVFHQLATHHLSQWQANLPHRTRILHDRNVLTALASLRPTITNSTGLNTNGNNNMSLHLDGGTSISGRNRLETEQRTRHERALLDLQTAMEGTREETHTKRTETMEALAEYRAEGREEVQRLEMERHRVEGRWVARLSQFKSDAENVKVRSMYTFALLLVIIADRSTKFTNNPPYKKKKKKDCDDDMNEDGMDEQTFINK